MILSQMAAGGITHNSLSLFLKGWSVDLGAPVSVLMLAIVAQIFVSAPLSPIAGALCDKYPSRLLFGIGLSGMAACFIAISFAAAAWHVIAIYALSAPFLVLCTATPANTLIARWFTRRIGLALGLTAFGLGLGGVLLPPLIAMLLPEVGWRLIWRGAGLIVLFAVMPLVLLVIRNQPTAREGLHYVSGDGTRAVRPHDHGHGPGSVGDLTWREVLSRRNFWLLVFIYVTVMGTGSAFHQNVGPFVASRGMGGDTAALLLSTMSLAHLAATLGLGMLVDRFGARLPLCGLALVVAAGLAIMIAAQAMPPIVFAAALIGLNTGVFTPMAAAISAEFGPRGFGRGFGMAMAFVPLSTPLAFALAKVQEEFGSYTPAVIGFIALLLVAALLALLITDPGRSSEPREPGLAAN